MNLSKKVRGYKKRLVKKFTRQSIKREQFNTRIDNKLIILIELISKDMETPYYVICEHALEIGLNEILSIIQDPDLKVQLQRHLIKSHLLVEKLKPMDYPVSQRLARIQNALKFLDLIETKSGSVEAVAELIRRLAAEA